MCYRWVVRWWAACLVCFGVVGAASGQERRPADLRSDLAEARTALEAYDYRGAERSLARARRDLERLSASQAEEVLLLSAKVALSLDRTARAEAYLVALLQRVPSFSPQPKAWPPEWLRALHRARRRTDRFPPSLELVVPPVANPNAPLLIQVRARDPSGVRRIRLVLEKPVRSFTMTSTDGGTFSIIIAPEYVQPPAVKFWLEAYDGLDNGPGYYAAPRRPTAIPVSFPVLSSEDAPVDRSASGGGERDSIFDTWWFWTLAGVVVVGAGVSTAVVLTDPSPSVVRANVTFQ